MIRRFGLSLMPRQRLPNARTGVAICIVVATFMAKQTPAPAVAASAPYVTGGLVISTSSTSLRLLVQRQSVTIQLQSSTQYEVATATLVQGKSAYFQTGSRSNIHLGDVVLAVVYRTGHSLIATQIEVLPESRYVRTISGVVSSVSDTQIVVVSPGKSYTITVAPQTLVAINGKPSPLSGVRPGDTVTVISMTSGRGLMANGIGVSQKVVPPSVALQGTLAVDPHTGLVLVAGSRRYSVQLTSGVRVSVNGQGIAIAKLPLFIGTHAKVAGTVAGSTIAASSIAVSAAFKVVTGRVASRSSGRLVLHLSSGRSTVVELPAGLVVSGTLAPKHTIPVGAFVQLETVVLGPNHVRALTGRIVTPSLNVSGKVVGVTKAITIQTAQDGRFRLSFNGQSVMKLAHATISVGPGDLPVGAPVHAVGVVQTDGSLAVTRLTVTLKAADGRGRVRSLAGGLLVVRVQSRDWRVVIRPDTAISQGSNALPAWEIVRNDDVSVKGFDARSGFVIASGLSLHRQRVQMAGTVSKLYGDGFTLRTKGGSHRVIVGETPGQHSIVAPTVSVGGDVTVIGYLRGDGAVLAWQVALAGG